MIYKVGVELEVNRERLEKVSFCKREIKRFIFIKEENNVIKEIGLFPIKFRNIKNLFRASILSGFIYEEPEGFNYKEGEQDSKAESCHLHISLPKHQFPILEDNFIVFFILLSFFSRNNHTFRDAISYRASLNLCLNRNSKEDAITVNTTASSKTNTIEFRINENPFLVLSSIFINYIIYLLKIKSSFIFNLKEVIEINLGDWEARLEDGYNLNEIKKYKELLKQFLEFTFGKFNTINIYNYYKNLYNQRQISNYNLIYQLLKLVENDFYQDLEVNNYIPKQFNFKVYQFFKNWFIINDKIYQKFYYNFRTSKYVFDEEELRFIKIKNN